MTTIIAPLLSPLVGQDNLVHDNAWLDWFNRIGVVATSPAASGALLAINNLSDVANIATSRTNLGLGTSSSPTFYGLTLSGLTASLPVVTDGAKSLSSISLAAFRSLIGLGTSSSPTFAGLTIDNLNGILRGNYGNVLTVVIGSSLSYDGTNLNTIQDIRTTASPTFAGLTISGTTIPFAQLLSELGSAKRHEQEHEARYNHGSFLEDSSFLRLSADGRRMVHAHEARYNHDSLTATTDDSLLLRLSDSGSRMTQAHEAKYYHSTTAPAPSTGALMGPGIGVDSSGIVYNMDSGRAAGHAHETQFNHYNFLDDILRIQVFS